MSFDAIIFDMDGLLVDSEPLWHEAEIEMIAGAGYTYAEDVREQTIGVRVDEFARIIHRHYPKVGESPQAIIEEITARILGMPLEKIQPRPGAEAIIRFAAEREIPRAIASSSWDCVIDHFVDLLGWDALIPQRYSAQHMARGKPAPDIYLYAAEQLGYAPARCLALEDSPAGTQSALAAGMTCYSVPDLSHSTLDDFAGINNSVYDSLYDILAEFERKGFFA
ncbi:MAG: HAD family phosphatase [Chloroflexi bacterium]|nr:HAD family phosphatase [Chloroflexota bacterium]